MKGYSQIAALLEKGISGIFACYSGPLWSCLMAGLVFVFAVANWCFGEIISRVGLIFDSTGSLEPSLFLLKLIDLALIAVLITIIALSSYQSFVDDIDHLETMTRRRRAEFRSSA